MAGDWIKMRVDLRDDPAVFRIAEVLGIDELHVVGCLFCFWAWTDKHAVDGRVDGATSRLVDKVSMTPGFADALVSVGWLTFDESGLQIPHFDRHNGESAKERSLKNARQARWRAKKDSSVDGQASTTASTTASTREEKRREDTSSLRSEVDTASKRRRKTTLPDDFCISDRVREWAGERGFNRLDEHLDAFKRKAIAKGYAYASWDDAFMEAIREDWAKLRNIQPARRESTTETFSERDERLARERVAAFAPGVAAKPRTQGTQGGTTSGMVFDVTSRLIQGQSNEVAA